MAVSSRKDDVWNKAKTIRGKDPAKYRQDPYGNVLYYASYGKDSKMGWEIDHIKPREDGGSDHLRNLQALSTRVNREKGASRKKRRRHSKR